MKPKKWLEPESRSQERRFANSRIINPAYVDYIQDFAKRAALVIANAPRKHCAAGGKCGDPDCIVLAASEYLKQEER